MAAKTSWHRPSYGTKLRHCHPMYMRCTQAMLKHRFIDVRHQTLGETTMTRAKMGKTQKYIYKIGENLIWLAEKQNCRFLNNLTQTHVQRYAADMR